MLSKKTQYAFKALMYIGKKQDKGPVPITEIAREKKIPQRFLENILLELKHAGILESKKGKDGGYFFRDEASSTTLARIMRLFDGPIALLPCVSLNFYEPCKNCNEKDCHLRNTLIQTRDVTLTILEKKTVADLI